MYRIKQERKDSSNCTRKTSERKTRKKTGAFSHPCTTLFLSLSPFSLWLIFFFTPATLPLCYCRSSLLVSRPLSLCLLFSHPLLFFPSFSPFSLRELLCPSILPCSSQLALLLSVLSLSPSPRFSSLARLVNLLFVCSLLVSHFIPPRIASKFTHGRRVRRERERERERRKMSRLGALIMKEAVYLALFELRCCLSRPPRRS